MNKQLKTLSTIASGIVMQLTMIYCVYTVGTQSVLKGVGLAILCVATFAFVLWEIVCRIVDMD